MRPTQTPEHRAQLYADTLGEVGHALGLQGSFTFGDVLRLARDIANARTSAPPRALAQLRYAERHIEDAERAAHAARRSLQDALAIMTAGHDSGAEIRNAPPPKPLATE